MSLPREALMDALRAVTQGERATALAAHLEELRARGVWESTLGWVTADLEDSELWAGAANELPVDAETLPLYTAALSALNWHIRRDAYWTLVECERVGVPELVLFLRAEAGYGRWKDHGDALDRLSGHEGGLRELVTAADPCELPMVATMLGRPILLASRGRGDPRPAAEARGLLRGLLHHPDGRGRGAAAVLLAAIDRHDSEAWTALRGILRGDDPEARPTAVRLLAELNSDLTKELRGDPDPALASIADEVNRVWEAQRELFSDLDKLRPPAAR